jgi:rSAM/selenodomain-associated transferase 1
MNSDKELLIIFQKNLEPGKVKTRLAKSIGDENALIIYKKLIKKTYQAVEKLPVTRWIFYSNYPETKDIWPEKDFVKHIQQGDDLGEKMYSAFKVGFEQEFQKICIIGTDCYDISYKILKTAFARLTATDVVVGPALDGGYYLIGMKKLHSKIFRNKKWSTSTVFDDTIKDISEEGLSCSLLKTLNDVDTIDDLEMIKSLKIKY